jgi:hypothetical protein
METFLRAGRPTTQQLRCDVHAVPNVDLESVREGGVSHDQVLADGQRATTIVPLDREGSSEGVRRLFGLQATE